MRRINGLRAWASGAAAVAALAAPLVGSAAPAPAWSGTKITSRLSPPGQNGWVSGRELESDKALGARFPGIDRAAQACRASYGVLYDGGRLVSGSARGQKPHWSVRRKKWVCRSLSGISSIWFVPADTGNKAEFRRLRSGMYRVNGWTQTVHDYETNQYRWTQGGTTHDPSEPPDSGVVVRVDNSKPTGSVTSPIRATQRVSVQPAIAISATELYSGLKAIKCSDTYRSKVVTTWNLRVRRFAKSYSGSIPKGTFPDRGESLIQCSASNAVGGSRTIGTAQLDLVRAASRLSVTLHAGTSNITSSTGHAGAALQARAGQPVIVNGTLTALAGGHDRGVRGAVVSIRERINATGRSKLVRQESTTGNGSFKVTIAAGPSREFIVSWAGGKYVAKTVVVGKVRWRAPMHLHVPATMTQGRLTTISGQVLGGYIPPGGLLVEVDYRLRGGRWQLLAVSRTTRLGRWHYRFTYSGRRNRFWYRMLVPRTYGWGYDGSVAYGTSQGIL